jgi:hypothetical protein
MSVSATTVQDFLKAAAAVLKDEHTSGLCSAPDALSLARVGQLYADNVAVRSPSVHVPVRAAIDNEHTVRVGDEVGFLDANSSAWRWQSRDGQLHAFPDDDGASERRMCQAIRQQYRVLQAAFHEEKMTAVQRAGVVYYRCSQARLPNASNFEVLPVPETLVFGIVQEEMSQDRDKNVPTAVTVASGSSSCLCATSSSASTPTPMEITMDKKEACACRIVRSSSAAHSTSSASAMVSPPLATCPTQRPAPQLQATAATTMKPRWKKYKGATIREVLLNHDIKVVGRTLNDILSDVNSAISAQSGGQARSVSRSSVKKAIWALGLYECERKGPKSQRRYQFKHITASFPSNLSATFCSECVPLNA